METPRTPEYKRYESLHRCTVCGKGPLESLYPPDVARCGECGIILRQTRPTPDDLRDVQDAVAGTPRHRAEGELRAAQQGASRRLRLVEQVVGPQQEAGRILLDIGAGHADFLHAAQGASWLVVGTEISEAMAEHGRRRGFEMLAGSLTEIGFSGRTFDAITLWNVLDYVPNPAETLQHILRLLKPRGMLFLSVANVDGVMLPAKFGRDGAGNPLGDLTPGDGSRLTHFQAKTLQTALKVNGFLITKSGGEGKAKEAGPWWQAPLAKLLGMKLAPELYAVAIEDRNPEQRQEDFE